MEWIPCSERLPREYSDDERVLATTDVDGLGVIIIPIYDVVSWYYKGYISAWMPLPEPYMADRETKPQYHADVECNYKDCDNCGHKEYCPQHKTEPQTECDTCRHYKLTCELFSEICKYEPKDEPQTEVSVQEYERWLFEEPQTMRDENYIYAYDKTHGEWYPIQEIERPCDNCQEWDCYGCDYKQVKRSDK